jgi:polysaccharide deacetylase 2 family uncharacterized protein YibQ
MIAIIVGGSASAGGTERAIARLPGEVTPLCAHGTDLPLAAAAREAGHEIFLQVPFSRSISPRRSRHTLLVDVPAAENLDRLTG